MMYVNIQDINDDEDESTKHSNLTDCFSLSRIRE